MSYFVYIMAHCTPNEPEGPVKVGVTSSLHSRLASIQTGNWRRIEIASYFDMGSRELALEAEAAFHDRMAEARMAGEWFGIEPREALNTLCDIVCTIIESRYPTDPEAKRRHMEISRASDALEELSRDWTRQ